MGIHTRKKKTNIHKCFIDEIQYMVIVTVQLKKKTHVSVKEKNRILSRGITCDLIGIVLPISKLAADVPLQKSFSACGPYKNRSRPDLTNEPSFVGPYNRVYVNPNIHFNLAVA